MILPIHSFHPPPHTHTQIILPIHSFHTPPHHSPFITLLIVLLSLLVWLAAMVTWTLQSRHAVFPVPNVSGLTNTSRYTVISSGRQTGRGRSDVLTSEWTQRSAVGEDLHFFADVRDFHFGCVGDLGTIPNSVLTSTVNRNKSVLDKSMSSHMYTIHHCILGIQRMRNCQSTIHKSTFIPFSVFGIQ